MNEHEPDPGTPASPLEAVAIEVFASMIAAYLADFLKEQGLPVSRVLIERFVRQAIAEGIKRAPAVAAFVVEHLGHGELATVAAEGAPRLRVEGTERAAGEEGLGASAPRSDQVAGGEGLVDRLRARPTEALPGPGEGLDSAVMRSEIQLPRWVPGRWPRSRAPTAPGSRIMPRMQVLAVGAVVMLAVGCKRSTNATVQDLTYVPAGALPGRIASECKSFPCDIAEGERTWKISKLTIGPNQEYPIPHLSAIYTLNSEGFNLSIRAGGFSEKDTVAQGGRIVPAALAGPLTTVFSDKVPCPKGASSCSSSAVIRDGNIISSIYSICYRPTTTGSNGATLTQSVKPEVVQGAWAYQAKRLPKLQRSIDVPVDDKYRNFEAEFTALTRATFDDESLFAAGREIVKAKSAFSGPSYVGCVDVFYLKKIPGFTDRVFAEYAGHATQETSAANKEKEDFDDMVVPR